MTDLVRSWLDGGAPNHGLAIAPVIDPSVDEGILTRFQIYGSEHSQEQYTPKLTVQVQLNNARHAATVLPRMANRLSRRRPCDCFCWTVS